jgi:hypothetical protein
MRSKLGNLCLLIIDDISMVGADHLYTIHKRLSEIMTCGYTSECRNHYGDIIFPLANT